MTKNNSAKFIEKLTTNSKRLSISNVTTSLIDIELRIGHNLVKVCGIDSRYLNEIKNNIKTMSALNNFLRYNLGSIESLSNAFVGSVVTGRY
jgi:hypothetical protein